jgi:uncharacterized protein YcbX
MDMDRTDWDIDFEDDADTSELDDAIEAYAEFEAELRPTCSAGLRRA